MLLASLLAHELTHAIVARRRGVEVLGVKLWLFGGIARLGGEAKTPGTEFRIAVSGPAMSLTLAAVFAGAAAGMRAVGSPDIVVAVAWWLAGINLILGLRGGSLRPSWSSRASRRQYRSTASGIQGPKRHGASSRLWDRLRLTPSVTQFASQRGSGTTLVADADDDEVIARCGEKIYFDDGRIGGEIVAVDPDVLRVRVDRAASAGSKLRAAKGINVPDTRLPVPALTDKDIVDLRTVVEIADVVEMSFVQDPSDVVRLHDELTRLGGDRLGVVLKIETRRAFERLPQLLLTAMRRPRVGVMIARGDLAVEGGYERLAELQEEILWLCEAAHLPVIWATQVLEQLAKSGLPSRAEISDAAMGERAECVMLNKGPHIDEAVLVLDDILCRMAEHHYKKNALLRQLHSWRPTSGV